MAKVTLDNNILKLAGDWTLRGIESVGGDPLAGIILPTYALKIDGSEISHLDSAGVLLIEQIENQLADANVPAQRQGFNPDQNELINLIKDTEKSFTGEAPEAKGNFFEKLGRRSVEKYNEIYLWMTFVGEFAIIIAKLFSRPKDVPWRSIVATIDFTGVRSMPIIAFLAFLIGVVLAYQIGVQLESYGANIYIVNFLGIAIFREFGPLIAAIILAGRVSSAFTAHIGLMKANEELDALETMGLCPVELLVLPRVLGMIIAMPLLVVWCDAFGIMGGMFMAKLSLDVSFQTFLIQFPQVITLTSFTIGLIKAPVFALIVSSVGCFHGLRVTGSATSIGEHTTKSVVLAIFLIIIADAIFSIVLSYLGV